MLYRGTAALEVWARRSVAGKVEVANLAEDWRDGRWVSPQEEKFALFNVFSKNRDFQFLKFSQRAEILSFQMCSSSRAFLALLHHHRPELVDLSRMEERDTITNCTEAFAIAEVSRDGGLLV